MLQSEFEHLIGREFTPEQYAFIEQLYMACDLDKEAFASFIRPSVLKLPKKKPRPLMAGIFLAPYRTPNGCWEYVQDAEVVDISVAKGLYQLKKVGNPYWTSEKPWTGSIRLRDCDENTRFVWTGRKGNA